MDPLLLTYTLRWFVVFLIPILLLWVAKCFDPSFIEKDVPVKGYLLSNLVFKFVWDLVFPIWIILFDIVEHIVTSKLALLEAMASWYQSRRFSSKLSNRWVGIIACFFARLIIDLVYYELTASGTKDYVSNHLHHIAAILFVILVLHYEALWSISIACVLAAMVMEVGSALLCLRDIFEGMYPKSDQRSTADQLPLFCPIHNYGFYLSDLLAFVIVAYAVWNNLRTDGIPESPLYWLLIAFIIILLITREMDFEPFAPESQK